MLIWLYFSNVAEPKWKVLQTCHIYRYTCLEKGNLCPTHQNLATPIFDLNNKNKTFGPLAVL